MKQIHVYFSGEVQGVGMRDYVKNLASSLKITGSVKNLEDGRVEMVAQNEESDVLSHFLAKIKEKFPIEDTDLSSSEDPQREFDYFVIE